MRLGAEFYFAVSLGDTLGIIGAGVGLIALISSWIQFWFTIKRGVNKTVDGVFIPFEKLAESNGLGNAAALQALAADLVQGGALGGLTALPKVAKELESADPRLRPDQPEPSRPEDGEAQGP